MMLPKTERLRSPRHLSRQFLDALDAEIIAAEQAAKHAGNFMRDSYADGHNDGYLDGLRWARKSFAGPKAS